MLSVFFSHVAFLRFEPLRVKAFVQTVIGFDCQDYHKKKKSNKIKNHET